jgi:hypothetical protein
MKPSFLLPPPMLMLVPNHPLAVVIMSPLVKFVHCNSTKCIWSIRCFKKKLHPPIVLFKGLNCTEIASIEHGSRWTCFKKKCNFKVSKIIEIIFLHVSIFFILTRANFEEKIRFYMANTKMIKCPETLQWLD